LFGHALAGVKTGRTFITRTGINSCFCHHKTSSSLNDRQAGKIPGHLCTFSDQNALRLRAPCLSKFLPV
jgi:hypothetical protein